MANKKSELPVHIEKRGDTYRFRVYTGKDVTGKQTFKRMTYKPTASGKRELDKELKMKAMEFYKRVTNNEPLEAEKITFAQYYALWKDQYGDELTARELEDYESNVNRIFMPVIGNMKLGQIRVIHLQPIIKSLEKQGLKPATIHKYFRSVSTVFTRAYKADLIVDNPCRRVTLPKIEKDNVTEHVFTPEQVHRFLSICREGIDVHHDEIKRKNGRIIPAFDEHAEIPLQFQVYYTLALYGGFRESEMIGLTWSNINFKKNVIVIDHAISRKLNPEYKEDSDTKVKKHLQYEKTTKSRAGNRTVSLPSECFDLLKDWQKEQIKIAKELGTAWEGLAVKEFDDQYLFIQENGKQMCLTTPYAKFKKIVKAYNASLQYKAAQCDDTALSEALIAQKLPSITLHDLRHSMASALVAEGTNIADVAKRLGHSDIKTTLNTYTHSVKAIDYDSSDTLARAFSPNSSNQITLSEEELEAVLKMRQENGSHLGSHLGHNFGKC